MDKIKGHTYIIAGGTNTGAFVFRDGATLLIDPGHSKARGRRIANKLKEISLRPRYSFTTHEHKDHFEAYIAIEEDYPSCELLAHESSCVFLNNPYIGNMVMYGASPSKLLGDIIKPFHNYINNVKSIQEGNVVINDKNFKIIHTPGHSMGSSSIITEDKVIFTGDAILDERILDKYKIPFIIDIDRYLDSLDKIAEQDFEFGVIAHAKDFYDKNKILELININKSKILQLKSEVFDLLTTPYSREELLKDMMDLYDILVNTEIYHYNNATIGSILSSLIQQDEIKYSIEDGRLIYYR